MASSASLFLLTHKVSSVSVDFKEPIASLQELRSRSVESCKTYINSVVLIPTNMSQGDNIKHPKAKHAEIVETVPIIERNNDIFNQRINMFRREVRNFKNQPYVFNCKQSQCPAMKERLEHHKCHHTRTNDLKKYKEQGINVSPDWSRLYLPHIAQLLVSDGKSVQTEITLEDFILQRENVNDTLNYLKDLTYKQSETKKDQSIIHFYAENLRTEILNWLHNVPVFYSVDFTPQYLKENILTVFVDRIVRLFENVNQKNYATNVKTEIDDCLNILPMWLPNSRKEQLLFKNSLKDKLYKQIQNLNNNLISTDLKNDEKKNSDSDLQLCIENEEKELLRSNSLYTKVVASWLGKINLNKPISKKRVNDVIVKRISSLMNVPLIAKISKTKLKSEILTVLDNLPIKTISARNRNVHLNRVSEELANKLLITRAKLESSEKCGYKFSTPITKMPIYNNQLTQAVHETVSKVIGTPKLQQNKDSNIGGEVHNVLLNSLESLRSGAEHNISNEISDVLTRTCNITAERAMNVAKRIKLYMKIALKHNKIPQGSSFHSVKPQLSGTMTVYRSNESGPITSTPKITNKNDDRRLNLEENAYMKNVVDLIRTWMEILPKKFDDDKEYKETIINDLAGNIVDEVKQEQLSPGIDTGKESNIKYFTYRWLAKFEIFTDFNDAIPLVEDFLEKLKQIPELQLTALEHGTRQAMYESEYSEKEIGCEEELFLPRGIDVLENQISVWMNEQHSEIYVSDYKTNRGEMVHKLAFKLQDRLRSKQSENAITEEIKQWLKQIVKPEVKEHLESLAQNLTDKIMYVPQDKTVETRNQNRMRQQAECPHNEISTSGSKANGGCNAQGDPEETMKEFILKYIEHNYKIDDNMAKRAFSQLLKTELRKLHPSTRQESYNHFPSNELLTAEKFANELEYISMISDWLKHIPINPLYNTTGNRARVDFVNDLAINIQEAEEQRKQYLSGMDYDLYLSSIISISLRTYNIPILPEHKETIPLMINQLQSTIISKQTSMNQYDSTISSVTEQNLSEFIDQFIRISNRDINNDEMKREAWTARLLKVVNKILDERTDPSKLSKELVLERLCNVPVPGKTSVRRFSLEMNYIKEISDWLKNLPLLPITDLPDTQNERVNMISQLAEKITEREEKKNSDPNDDTADKNLIEYITKWISKLQSDPGQNLEVPIIIQQLMSRVQKVNGKNLKRSDSSLVENPILVLKEVIDKYETIKDPGTYIVDWIENWCNKLPIQGSNHFVMNTKQEIARALYKKVGELNVSPRICNDDTLYKSLLEDEIDSILENLPQCSELQNNRNSLKAELLHNILSVRMIIGQHVAGDNYKHKLETTIDAAIPNPVQNRKIIDPGFEMYKKHLANMFILENFDHSEDNTKNKYEKRIREEVDKYFESALQRNALPITKSQMYNELYSELFKVPMPSEDSMVDEVEEVKTRYEIGTWFHDLPLREANSKSEYLECDHILSTLAKRIHSIEKYEKNPDEKIHNVIRKWLQKLPLISLQQSNIDHYVSELQSTINSSADARKYVAAGHTEANATTERIHLKRSPNMSQVTSPSAENQNCACTATAYKRPGDLIVEIVEDWCDKLELTGDEIQNKLMKDNLSTKIVIKICTLNMDERILNDDIVYDQLLSEELDRCISDLPTSHEYNRNKRDNNHELIEMIRLIKPLVREANKKYEYKTELKNTITSILNGHNETVEKLFKFNKVKEEILDSFLQFNYNQDDVEAKQFYKRKLHDAVIKHVTGINDNDKQPDPLIQSNQLLCELLKIPVPNNTLLKDEVDEIKLKNEVEQFFEENSLNDNTEETTQVKKTLTKRLNEVEKSGHNDFNDEKMKSEIARFLNKLHKDINPEVIKEFVNDLKNNEAERSRPSNDENHEKNKFARSIDSSFRTPQAPLFYPGNSYQRSSNQRSPQVDPNQFLQVPPRLDWSHCRTDPQLVSLESATSKKGATGFYEPSNTQQFGPDKERFGHWQNESNHRQFQSCPSNDNGNSFRPDISSFYNSGNTNQWENPPYPLLENNKNHLPNSIQPFYASQEDQHKQNQPFNYNGHRSSYRASPPSPANVSQTSFRSSYNRSCAPLPSEQRSINDAASYREIATPRRVQGEANAYEPIAPQIAAPDSMFQYPISVPKRLHSDISQFSGSPSCSSRGLRPSLIPSGRSSLLFSGNSVNRTARFGDLSGRIRPCVCGARNKCKSRSYYMVPVEEYCEECGGFTNTWCRIPTRGCFYMQCF